MGCGADIEANELIVSLTAGKNFNLPDIDLEGPEYDIPTDEEGGIYAPITRLTNADLTTGTIDGSGTFDALMRGFKVHLRAEYDAGRITGAEYTKAYTALVEGAMSNATQYLLGRDAAYWQAVSAQLQARQARVLEVLARVQLQTAKVQMVALQYEALTNEANYALSKIKLATESVTYCTGKYSLEQIMPIQKTLMQEQVEVQRAQTIDTRVDGTPILGAMGKQKELYTQQITSYKRDAEVKAAKIFTDAWITMKTIDEGLALTSLKTNNAI
jgi:hypothetical protein